MTLKPGDWVKSHTGEIGKVVNISRLTVFVAIAVPGKPDNVVAILESQLKKIEPPPDSGSHTTNT